MSGPEATPAMPPAGTPLCRLDEIAAGTSRGFRIGGGAAGFEMFVVRHSGGVVGYVNRCPHIGTPLDWRPDRFLSRDGSRILCATHGALFRIEDGHCVSGPCAGRALTRVPIEVVDETVRIGR